MSQIKAGIVLSYVSIFIINLAGLITTPIIVETLGVDDYGVYLIILSFVAYIGLVDLGITTTINRFVAKYRAEGSKIKEGKFLSNILNIVILVIFLIVVLGFLLENNINYFIGSNIFDLDYLKKVIWILIATLILNVITGFINGYIAAYEKFIFIKTLTIIKAISRLLLLLFIFSNKGDIFFLVILDFFIAIFVAFTSFIYFLKIKESKIYFFSYDSSMINDVFNYSVWAFIFSLISQIQWQSGQILIGYKLDSASVGIYGIGIVLGTYYGAFSVAISGIFVSRTTYKVYQNNNNKELTDYMIQVGHLCAIVMMLILVNFISIGEDFIKLWVGEEFQPAWTIALMIMLIYTVPLVQGIANQVLEAKKLFKFKSKVYLFCLVSGSCLGFFLIDYYDIYGMIIGIAIGWSTAITIMTIYYHKKLKLDMIKLFNSMSGLLIVSIFVSIFGYSLNFIESSISWIAISIKASVISVVYVLFIYKYVLLTNEKSLVHKVLSYIKL